MKKILAVTLLLTLQLAAPNSFAATYVIDTKGMHAAINFRIKHIGISWLTGRFDKFEGHYTFDKDKPEASKVSVKIDVRSVNSNHAIRDKHISEADYLNVGQHPTALFESTKIEITGEKTGIIHGNLTLNGTTKTIALKTDFIGSGDDPWGGYRTAFQATTKLNPTDFNFKFDYGSVFLDLYVEGIRK